MKRASSRTKRLPWLLLSLFFWTPDKVLAEMLPLHPEAMAADQADLCNDLGSFCDPDIYQDDELGAFNRALPAMSLEQGQGYEELSTADLLSQLNSPSPRIETAGSRPRLRTEPQSSEDTIFRPRRDVFLDSSYSRYSPGIAVFNPIGFGQSLGDLSVGFGFQERTRFSQKSDGAVGINFGLGDPENLVGLDVNISLTDLSDFFDRGIVGFHLHRLLRNDLAIAIGLTMLPLGGMAT
ncbi:MAG: hypothetical protein HC810_05325 [Acaryochloridaceae cyanobacterium RL_2_7]|nr:hypothetical protein [Acaryochloridaceae cyanobacterium RL_2_7]